MAEGTDPSGNVLLHHFKIRGTKLPSDKIMELNIYEAIDFPAITGNVLIDDWGGLKEEYEFFSNDIVEIKFNREGDPPITVFCVLYESGGENPMPGEHHKKVIFEFCSPWWVHARSLKITNSWSNKYIHEIIIDLVEMCGGKMGVVDATKQKLERFVAPNWTPIRIIQSLMQQATDENGCGGYLIWTDISDGKVNFISLNSLMVDDKDWNYGYVPFKLTLNPNTTRSLQKVFGMNIENSFSMIDTAESGMGNMRTVGFDYDRTEVIDINSRIDKYKHSHLSTKMPLNTVFLSEPYQTTSFSTFYPNNRELIQTEGESESLQVANILTKQSLMLSTLVRVNITTVGENKAKRAGRLVWLDVPYLPNKNHAQYTGTYLLKNVRHRIQGAKYMNVCTLVCDGLKKMSDRDDIVSWGKENNDDYIVTFRKNSGERRSTTNYRSTSAMDSLKEDS